MQFINSFKNKSNNIAKKKKKKAEIIRFVQQTYCASIPRHPEKHTNTFLAKSITRLIFLWKMT